MSNHTITDRRGDPKVFDLAHNDDGLWLNNNFANPDNKWNADNEFMFRLRKYFFSVRLGETVFLLRIVEILLPTAKHTTCFAKFQCQFLVFAVRNDFALPSDGNKEF